jgi:hypothetical protein
MKLAPEQIYDPHEYGERQTHDNAGHDRKIKGAVAAWHNDVTGQTSKPEGKSYAKR